MKASSDRTLLVLAWFGEESRAKSAEGSAVPIDHDTFLEWKTEIEELERLGALVRCGATVDAHSYRVTDVGWDMLEEAAKGPD